MFPGLTYYSEILGSMFSSIEDEKRVTVPLNAANPTQSNVDYVYQYVGNLLKNAFPHLTEWVSAVDFTLRFYSFSWAFYFFSILAE